VDPPPRFGATEAGGRDNGSNDDDENDGEDDQEDDEDSDDDRDSGDGGWYGLDPHVVQLAPRGTRVLVKGTRSSTTVDDDDDDDPKDAVDATTTITTVIPNHRWQVQLTESYLRSLHISSTVTHANHRRSIPLSKLDPSCALGFYVRDHSDFVRFKRSIEALSVEHCRPNLLPEIVTISERTPNYELDVSSAINDMIGGGGGIGAVSTGGGGKSSRIVDCLDGFSMKNDVVDEEDDDDDDFVLI
jgi:hypothetical protein